MMLKQTELITNQSSQKPMPKEPKKQTYSKTQTRLRSSNYYDIATDWPYQSVSWFKKFMNCEAEALAELKGTWRPERDQTALLVGNYLHSYFESKKAHEAFIKAHETDIKTRSGTLRAPFQTAESMIYALRHYYNESAKRWRLDKDFLDLYRGRKEVIVTGNIFGIKWKGKLDCLNLNRQVFIDLKTTRSIRDKQWNPETMHKESFIYNYNYYLQLAVYQELIKQQYGVECRPIIYAVSKEKVPDKQGFIFTSDEDQWQLQRAMETIKALQPHIEAVKTGEEKPIRCEHCDYCKATRGTTLMPASEL
ncbi:PD-(D/E)XK nuclease-like domain-containing protein [Agrilactobacillus fermenti]|uniref:PD-(D/E)XK nuclease-like domain-containing protein n=1 Tax=Agrilactobacillus fermenti TaxID=2586909 RepID=UPI003A5BCEEE